jgi:uncharacterized protein YutE (UPF0331/DUF86 family)
LPNVVVSKLEIIDRCLQRVNEEFGADFKENFTKQDSVILNLERASQAAMDIAAHIIKVRNLGVPKSSKNLFEILYENGYITKEVSSNLKKMVAFRNIAVHSYQDLNLDIVVSVVKEHLNDFKEYKKEIIESFL